MVPESAVPRTTICVALERLETLEVRNLNIASAEQPVLVSQGEHATLLTLNRPDKLNPLDWATVRALLAAVDALQRSDSPATVVITGAGRAFSSGGDLRGYIDLYKDANQFGGFLEDFWRLLDRIESSDKVFIAAINGACVAGGLELMLACDLVLASQSARIGDGHLNFGQLPGAGGSQRLPRAIGMLRAKHLMFTGDLISASDACAIGLVGEVTPDDGLLPRARDIAASLASRSPAGVRSMKRLVNEGMQQPRAQALRFEIDMVIDYATRCPDATEGLLAFAEKRSPRYER